MVPVAPQAATRQGVVHRCPQYGHDGHSCRSWTDGRWHQKIADTFESYRTGTLEDEAGYCAVKSLLDIQAQDFILTPGRYVGIAAQEDDGEPFADKMNRLTSELSGLFAESHRLEEEIKKQLGSIGYKI